MVTTRKLINVRVRGSPKTLAHSQNTRCQIESNHWSLVVAGHCPRYAYQRFTGFFHRTLLAGHFGFRKSEFQSRTYFKVMQKAFFDICLNSLLRYRNRSWFKDSRPLSCKIFFWEHCIIFKYISRSLLLLKHFSSVFIRLQ